MNLFDSSLFPFTSVEKIYIFLSLAIYIHVFFLLLKSFSGRNRKGLDGGRDGTPSEGPEGFRLGSR